MCDHCGCRQGAIAELMDQHEVIAAHGAQVRRLLAQHDEAAARSALDDVLALLGPHMIAIDCDGAGLHVRVRDGSTDAPIPASAEPQAESGRGLTLVQLISDTWGVEPVADDHGPGKEVWFELRRQGDRRSPTLTEN